jgi:DNA-binding transcriptional ArsR family regulator
MDTTLMTTPTLDELNLLHTNMCHAIADPKRIQILYALHEQPRNVTALAEALETPQPTISRHLTILRERSIVLTERDGTSVTYRIADPRVIEVLDVLRLMLKESLEKKTNAIG